MLNRWFIYFDFALSNWSSSIDITAEPTITLTYPNLCLYQYRRCCFVMLFQLYGFVGVLVVGTAWGLNPWISMSLWSWLRLSSDVDAVGCGASWGWWVHLLIEVRGMVAWFIMSYFLFAMASPCFCCCWQYWLLVGGCLKEPSLEDRRCWSCRCAIVRSWRIDELNRC